MIRATGVHDFGRTALVTDAATQPAAGCERCGGAVAATMIDGRPATHCDHCGLVAVGRPVATDGGQDVADSDDDGDDSDECECAALNQVDAGDDLECWRCFRAGGDDR